MSSLVHLILWVTMVMIGASIVLYVKTNGEDKKTNEDEDEDEDDKKGDEKKNDDEKIVENNKDENNKDDDDKKKSQQPVETTEEKEEEKTSLSSPMSSTPPPPPSNLVPAENVVMYIFAATGLVMAIVSWVVEQKGDVSFVGLSLLLSLMVFCLGFGGIAGVITELYLPREHLLGVAKAVCALTGLVVIGILSMIRGGM